MRDGDDRRAHWEQVYTTKAETEVSWFQDNPEPSLDLIEAAGAKSDAAIIDIGGGASRLADKLLERGFGALTVLDLSAVALQTAKARMGERSASIRWIAADVTGWDPDRSYNIWHDRAAFHFLTEPAGRRAYVERMAHAVGKGGHAIIATFAEDGPERCSGLPVVRYSATSLAAEIGPGFRLVESQPHLHATPAGATQSFQFSLFEREG